MSVTSETASPGVELALLRTERALHLAALDALSVGLVVVAQDLRVLLSNRAFDRSLGGRPERITPDVLDGAGLEVISPDGSPWRTEQWSLRRVLDEGRVVEGQLVGLRRPSCTTWVLVSARPLHEPGELDGPPYAALATFTDITRRREADLAVEESEAHFRLLAENSTDVITRHAADGTCLYASPALRDLVGREPAELVGRQAPDFVHPDDVAALTAALVALLRSGEVSCVRYRMSHVDGRWVWVETAMRPVRVDGLVLELQSSTRDVCARVEAERRLARLALSDALTGLANRAALHQHLEDVIAAEEPLALLFLDLDRFKVVNDSLGHSAGDELLRVVAARLSGIVRDGDLVARLGGDEFVVVAVGLDEDGALLLADRVQRVLSSPVTVAGHELVATASVGIVVSGRGAARDAEALLRDADISMYQAKDRGRARAVIWDGATGGCAVERLTVENQLRVALEHGQLQVHYQPQVELGTDRVVGVEALVRWAHPTRGLLLPAAFLQVAEDTGMLLELGRQVLHVAALQVAQWRRLPGCDGLCLSVNVSGQELLDPGKLDLTVQTLEDCGLPTSAVTFEVLESVLLDPEGAVVAALATYARRGFGLALDDFGTGSSSLLHLRQTPVGAVKIDRTFIAGLGRNRQDEAIVRALLALTSELGLSCVAEGVELESQRSWLEVQGVRVAQGYLLSRPVPAQALSALLAPAPG